MGVWRVTSPSVDRGKAEVDFAILLRIFEVLGAVANLEYSTRDAAVLP